MNQTIRPSILPDNKKLITYPLIFCMVISTAGILTNNLIVTILLLIVLAVFPGLPIFFHFLIHSFVKIELYPHKIIIKDYIGNAVIRVPSKQEIAFADIRYIYYLGKEINLLKNLIRRFKKYKLPITENNFTKENLTGKYGVPAEKIEEFEKDSHNILNDYTATSILMKLNDICIKYNIPKKTIKEIGRELKHDEYFNYEYIKNRLKSFPVDSEDLRMLEDEFTNIKTDVIQPFLLTKVNLKKYNRCSHSRGGISTTAKVDNSLILTNKDGTEKVLLLHFHDLSRQQWQSLIHTIKNNNPNITFLMTQSECSNLFT